MSIKGKHSVDHIHKELGHIMWEYVGMARDAEGLKVAIEKLQQLKKDFLTNLRIPGDKDSLNVELEKASDCRISSSWENDGSRCTGS
jgi:succinate dehydrogenase / fumarate reductase flavoprotein subunit